MKTIRRIGGWLAPYRGRMILAMGLTALACLFNLPVPLLVQGLVDRVVTQGHWSALPLYAALLFGVFAAQAALAWSTSLAIGKIGQGVVRDLRHSLYERLQQLGMDYFDKTPSGAIISRVMDDVGAIQVFVTSQTFTIITDLATTLAIAALLLSWDWRLAVVVFVVVPLFALNFRYFLRRIRATNTIVREKMDLIFGNLKAKLDGTMVIKAYAREPQEIAEFAAQLDDAHVTSGAGGPTGGGLFQSQRPDRRDRHGAGVRGRCVGGARGPDDARRRGRDGRPGGDDLRARGAAGRPGVCLRADGRERRPARRDPRPRAGRRRAGAGGGPGAAGPGRAVRGAVEFDRVGFGYLEGEPVVWDIRLKVEPGMKIALVGPTGCGKSTLVNLLMRFYDPTWGEIRLDDVPIRTIPTRTLRRQIGVVMQEPVMFRLSLADNIRYGASSASDAEVEAAAKAARVARVRHGPARRLCHDRRRGRTQAQSGRAATAGDRPRPLQGAGPGGPRRGDQLAGYPQRGPDPGCTGELASRSHRLHHRPPALDDRRRRPDHRDGRRPDRPDRDPRPAHGRPRRPLSAALRPPVRRAGPVDCGSSVPGRGGATAIRGLC